jgi:uncharacterized protein (UPF0332 family)
MTDYSELLDQGLVKRGNFARRQVQECLHIARRDLGTAKIVIMNSDEWAFNIAYNAMYQAGRAFMFHHGYRAAGHSHHATVVRFLEIGLGPEYEEMLALMDRMRRKRNRATYDMVGTISNKEAQEAISAAREFVARMERLLRRKKE